MSIFLLTMVLGLFVVAVKAENCTEKYFGPSCKFRCNCLNMRCNSTTGECLGDKRCQFGYFGPACQYLSEAYKQTTQQSSTESGRDSSRAVDGDMNTCSATTVMNNPIWHVEFPDPVWLTWVDIHFLQNITESDRFDLFAYNGSESVMCRMTTTLLTPLNLRGKCEPRLKMTRLQIIRVATNVRLVLCEVLVYGGRNMALLKEATQSSEYVRPFPASLAVDGETSTEFTASESCTHTVGDECPSRSGSLDPWWRVDFLANIELYRVVIYNRRGINGGRLNDFRLRVSQSGSRFMQIYRDTHTPAQEVTSVLMPTNQTGRFLEVKLKGDCKILTLCEVQVFGDCLDLKYGLLCEKNCSCRNSAEVCDKVDGSCLSGCADGITGTDCKEVCPDRTYGRNCSEKCSVNCVDGLCDKRDGSCTCSPGFQGEKCTQPCDRGMFGAGCSDRCATCSNDECFPGNGTCVSGCNSGFSGPQCLQAIQEPSNVAGIAAGVVLALVSVAVILVLLFLWWRRQQKRQRLIALKLSSGQEVDKDRIYENVNATANNVDNHSIASDEINNHVDITMETEMDDQTMTLERLKLTIDASLTKDDHVTAQTNDYVSFKEGGHILDVADLPNHMIMWRQNGDSLMEEFKALPRDLQVDIPHSVGRLEANQKKNRYKNICAYDHSRVKLTPFPGDSSSDYINANYTEGYTKREKFIASQGPTKKMIEDFCRMLWELKIPTVVMLTNVIEEGKRKCERYWDDEDELDIGDFVIEVLDRTHYAHYTYRVLQISEVAEPDVTWIVKHYHYTAWPDKSVPLSPWSLIDFKNKVMGPDRDPGHIVVHCSAGVGRTGTFIGLDTLMKMADEVGYVDVFDCVERMRKSRVNMVQTVDQYILLHEALALSVLLPPMTDSHVFLHNHVLDDAALTSEYMNISSFVGRDSVRFKPGSLKASESMMSIADDTASQLSLHSEEHDYSETVYVPSYFYYQAFMLMDTPDENSAADFYKWAGDLEISNVVTLDHLDPVCWPEEGQTIEFPELKVTCTQVRKEGITVIRTLNIQQEHLENEFFQFTCPDWADSTNLFDKPQLVLDFVKVVRDKTSFNSIVVMSSPAHGDGGIFCCVSNILELLEEEQKVGVPHILSLVRASCPNAIRSVAEYKLCYDCVRRHLETAAVYSNVNP